MKILKSLLMVFCLVFAAHKVTAQTNNVNTNEISIIDSIKLFGRSLFSVPATNFDAVAYGTYAPNAPTKYGGGVLLLWNLNQNFGAGMGFDELGHLSMPQATATFQLPIRPLVWTKISWLTNVTVYPNTLAALAIPVSGKVASTRGVGTVYGYGGSIDLFTVLGAKFGAGYEKVNWSGVGNGYDGWHHEGFVRFRKDI